MTTIIRNSIIVRLLLAICTFLSTAWRNGTLTAAALRWREYQEESNTGKRWKTFGSAKNPATFSLYAKGMDRLRDLVCAIGEWVVLSTFYRVLMKMVDFYHKITEGSRLFAQINRLSLRQWLLVAFAFYLPLEYLIRDRLAIPVLSSIWEEGFLLAALLIVVWRRALKKTDAIKRETPIDAYLILFFAVGLFLLSAVSPYPAVAIAGYRAQVEYMLWFFLMIRLLETEKDLKLLYGAFVLLGSLLCLHGIYQYIVAVPIPANWVSQTEMGVRTRVFSLTGSPNIFGSLIVMLAPLAAGLLYYMEKVWQKLLFAAVTGMMCLCLLFTFSRGAWVGMVIAVVLFSWFIDKRLLAVMGGVVAAVLVFVPSITSRLTYLFTSDYAEASAVGGRAVRWATGKMLLQENNPWLGFGLGRFGGAVAMNNKLLDETEEFSYFYMDNYYLKTMVEMGYLGLLFFLLLLAVLVLWGFRSIAKSDLPIEISGEKNDPLWRAVGNPKILAVSIFSGLCGVLTHCYFENVFEEPYMMAYFWALAAALLYLGLFRNQRLCPNR